MEGLFPLIRQEIDLINAANIIPGKTIQIAAKNVAKFKAGAGLSGAVN